MEDLDKFEEPKKIIINTNKLSRCYIDPDGNIYDKNYLLKNIETLLPLNVQIRDLELILPRVIVYNLFFEDFFILFLKNKISLNSEDYFLLKCKHFAKVINNNSPQHSTQDVLYYDYLSSKQMELIYSQQNIQS